jgi:hypothetical protein
VEGGVGLHPFRIGTPLSAVQQTGRLMAGFWSDAPHAPKVAGLSDSFRALEPDPLCGLRSVLGSRKQDVDSTGAT